MQQQVIDSDGENVFMDNVENGTVFHTGDNKKARSNPTGLPGRNGFRVY